MKTAFANAIFSTASSPLSGLSRTFTFTANPASSHSVGHIPDLLYLSLFHVANELQFPSPATRVLPRSLAPVFLEILREVRLLLEKENLLKREDKTRIGHLEKKLEKLIAGGYVSTPRRKIDF